MMREKSLSALTGTALGMLLAIGSIGCLLSAFGLSMQNPAAVWGTVFLFGAMYALCLQWKQGSLVYACILALSAGYLLRFGTAAEEAKRLLQHLSRVYDRAYHWGILQFEGVSPEGSVDLTLGIWAVLIILAAIRTVNLGKSCWLPVLLALTPLAACVVVTDTVPDEKFLFILLAAILLLILPASVRRENRLQGIRLTAAAVLPVLLGLGILFYAVPQNSYVNQSAVIQENLRTAVNHLPQLMEDGLENTVPKSSGRCPGPWICPGWETAFPLPTPSWRSPPKPAERCIFGVRITTGMTDLAGQLPKTGGRTSPVRRRMHKSCPSVLMSPDRYCTCPTIPPTPHR